MSKVNMTDFYVAAKPLMDYLKTKHHPHVHAIVTGNGATLSEDIIHMPAESVMNDYFFTFGMNHVKEDGSTLYYNYVRISATCENDARLKMQQARGAKWAFSYPKEAWDKCVKDDHAMGHSATEIPLHEVVIQWDKKEP